MQTITGYEFERRRLSPVSHSAKETSIRISDKERGTKRTTFPVQVQKLTSKPDLAILTGH